MVPGRAVRGLCALSFTAYIYLPSQEEEEEHPAHDLRVHLADRLSQRESIHLAAVALAHLPAHPRPDQAHGKKDGAHSAGVAPVQEELWRDARLFGLHEQWDLSARCGGVE